MTKRNIKRALGNSLKAEEAAVKNRFEMADAYLGNRSGSKQTEESVTGGGSGGANQEKTDGNATNASNAVEVQSIEKVIKDTFTMPSEDYQLINVIRERCLKQGIVLSKSETVRAGLIALFSFPDQELKEAANSVKKVKTGRPKFI